MDDETLSSYSILKVSPKASHEELRAAYKSMARLYHPDHNPKKTRLSTERFRAINEAWLRLNTPEKRRFYDLTLLQKQEVENANDNLNVKTSWLSNLVELLAGKKNINT